MQRLFIFCWLMLATGISRSQNSTLIKNYIESYKDLAIEEMQRTGVPASVKLAQGIHETLAGTGRLVQQSNNHFGIKCKSNWTGETVRHDDDARGECFRKYPSATDSYRDHSDFLKNNQRYAALFSLDPTDYAGWANGLKKAGYATNPKYPQALIKLIEDYQLQEYTLIALGKSPRKEEQVIALNEKMEPEKEIITPIAPAPVYPEGRFLINETKVVYVKKGTSFLSVATTWDVDLSKIFEFNDIPRSEAAEKDQLIYLQRKRKTGSEEFHIVQPGETLHDIAQLRGIRLESLQEYNWLKKEDRPAIGEKLYLRSKSPATPKLAIKENYTLLQPGTNRSTN